MFCDRALYVACDDVDKIVVIVLEKQAETNFPTALPTAVPTEDYFPQADPLSYTDNLTCSAKSCGQIWPDAAADVASSRFDSPFVCGGACFSESGRCREGDLRCAFNTVDDDGATANATEANFSSWSDARDFCEAGGARLCTVDEVAFDETRGTGCWSEDALLWTSTACFLNPNETTPTVSPTAYPTPFSRAPRHNGGSSNGTGGLRRRTGYLAVAPSASDT